MSDPTRDAALNRPDVGPRTAAWILAAILLAAALLRLPGLTVAPAGLNQDEAANAWNAWCLLKTGVDQHGAPWPIFCFRELGSNRSTLYLYLVMPFQLLFGLDSLSVRLPNALGGIALVGLTYFIAARLTDRTIALSAAALMAVQPWNLYMSRWGNEGGLTGLLAVIPLASLIWAHVPPARASTDESPRPYRALLGGLASGLACYGYPAVRLLIPVLLLGLAAASSREWVVVLRSRRGWSAAVAFAVGFLALFGPLAWMHVFRSEEMNLRGRHLWAWDAHDPISKVIEIIGVRYGYHFHPDFLFRIGDEYDEVWPSGRGILPWASAPLIVLGAFWLLRKPALHSAGGVLLIWSVVYPAGDILTGHYSAHAMRAAPGMALAAILAAIGMVETWRALAAMRLRILRTTLAVAAGGFLLWQSAEFAVYLLVERPTEQRAQQIFHADLVEACRWLGPRLNEFDRVYFTVSELNHPYIIAACTLPLDPREWHAAERETAISNDWILYKRVGKLRFLYDCSPAEQLAALRAAGERCRAAFIVRDGELPAVSAEKTIRDAQGRPRLHIVRVDVPARAHTND